MSASHQVGQGSFEDHRQSDGGRSRSSPKKAATGVIVVVAVLAVVVVGLVGWFGRWWPQRDPSTGGTALSSSPTDSSYSPPGPGQPQVVPFDVVGDLSVPDDVSIVAQQSSVAVFQLTYDSNSASDENETHYRVVLRGIRFTTGELLWTHEFPNLIDWSFAVEDGDLAMILQVEPTGSATWWEAMRVSVLSIETGIVVINQVFPPPDDPSESWGSNTIVYQDGIVVIQTVGTGFRGTKAYRVDDLTTPLWQVRTDFKWDPDLPYQAEDWAWREVSDRVLPPGWVQAGTGLYSGYVSIQDGRRLDRVFIDEATSAHHMYTSAGAMIIEDTSLESVSTLAGWTDLTASKPVWSHEFGGELVESECLTADAMLVARSYWNDTNLSQDDAGTLAIRLQDGRQLWSIPPVLPQQWDSCAGLSHGDQLLVALVAHSQVVFIDETTGNQYGRWDSPLASSWRIDDVTALAGGLALVRSHTTASPEAVLMVVDFSSPEVATTWTDSTDWTSGAIQTEAGVFLARTTSSGYEFLLW